MLKINLLQKISKANLGPFANIMDKIGLSEITTEDLIIIKNVAIKLTFFVFCAWLSNYIPERIKQNKMAELDQKIAVVTAELQKSEKELKLEARKEELLKTCTCFIITRRGPPGSVGVKHWVAYREKCTSCKQIDTLTL